MDRKIKKCLKELRAYIELEGKNPQQAYQELRSEYQDEDYSAAWREAVEEAVKKHKEQIAGIERLGVGKRLRGQRHDQWYTGPKDDANFWPAYVKHLESKGDEWTKVIPSIDKSSTNVVSMLPNPGATSFSGRGLVLGYVQSGKTANMTGVLAKAADSNYRFIIILAGMTDKLRNQTQKRFIKDLISHNEDGIWQEHTAPDHDFCEQTSPGFVFGDHYRHIMVVKKNTHVLKRLLNKLKNTNESERKNCSVLIIDDECDQASVNASGYLNKMTTINRHVREIIDILPRVSYLGYTATPFANLLIDPSVDPDNPEDLYPRDFIYTLPKPDDYFGAERIFGRDMLDADDEPPADESLDILRSISEDEWDSLRPKNAAARASFEFEVTDSLQEAIDYFLLATCARNIRGDRDKHSSMLIHTTMLVNPQDKIAEGIRNYLNVMKTDIGRIKKQLAECWDRENQRVESNVFGLTEISFNELWEEFEETLANTQVAVENGESTSRVNYDENEGQGKRYIVVGGNVLARGLTIEGLVVSFFLRTSAQYCTLMQMGRWFGYRHNFEDLPRIWMTDEMRSNFLDLATVEAEIRYEIEVYEKSELTPLDCAVKIRKLPGLAITAKNKMMAANRCQLSLNGSHRQTRRFYDKDKGILCANWTAGVSLLNEVVKNERKEIQKRNGGRLLSGVPVKYIETFLNEYKIHEKHPDLVETKGNKTTNHLLEHIKHQNEKNDGSHSIWNIVIVEPGKGNESELNLGRFGKVKTVNRSCFQRLDNGDADIKALMSKSDLKIDLPEGVIVETDWNKIKQERMKHDESTRPLLLLYAIDRNSEPQNLSGKKKTIRTKLEAAMDVLAIGLVFPGIEDKTDTVYYVQVDVEEDTEDEDKAWEEEGD